MNGIGTVFRILAGPARMLLAKQFRRRYEPLLQQSHDRYEAQQDPTWRSVDHQFAVALKIGGVHSRERLPQPSLQVKNLREDAQFRSVVVVVHVSNRDGSETTDQREHNHVQHLRHPMVTYEVGLSVPVVSAFDYHLEIEWSDGVRRTYHSPTLHPLHSDVLDPPTYRMYAQVWHTRGLDHAFRSFSDQLGWATQPDTLGPGAATHLNSTWKARALRMALRLGLRSTLIKKGVFWTLLLGGRAQVDVDETFHFPPLDQLIDYLKPENGRE